MKISALSLVVPFGDLIASGTKTIETRTWEPPGGAPLRNLLLVQNYRRLTGPDEVDPDGVAVAIVDITQVRPMTEDDAEAACCDFEPGLLAWVIENVRVLEDPFPVPAKRRVYELEVPDSLAALLS